MITVTPGTAADTASSGGGAAAARQQIRGSGLLLVGRIFSVAAKTGAQVLVVRYLTTSDYGAWAYALAAVAFLGGFSHLSLDRAVARFASIYHEEKQYDRFFGVIALVLITVVMTGTLFVAAFHLMPDLVSRITGGDARVVGLLLVMVFLVPLEALDTLLIALFAVFARPRAIFVRRYIITPAVQVSLVLLLIGLDANVQFLAYGYVAGTLIGALVSLWLLFRILRQQGLLQYAWPGRISMPIRELFSFSAPLMTSDWLTILTHSSGALVLGYLYTSEDVALFRVVMPLAALNQLVIQSFHLLYIPTAARLFARGDRAGMNDLYWRTTLWIAVLTFPVFALTFAAATPLTVLFFGARYEAAGAVLAVLAVGQYVQAALGFNGATIKVLGRVRLLVAINVIGALINVVLTLLLIPWLGVMGAAIVMSATQIIHNVLKQFALSAASGFPLLDRRYSGSLRTIAAGTAALLILPALGVTSSYALFGAAAVVTALVLAYTRHMLAVGEVFPELTRHPVVRRLLA
jgi:O-antigen/teichoic acid export membrane protein